MEPKYLELPVYVADAERAGILVAEAVEAGALGLEERDTVKDGVELLFYLPQEALDAVRGAIGAGLGPGDSVGCARPVPGIDWASEWQKGFAAVEISPRLVVRPGFVGHAASPGQASVVIDPGQAFGTGAHHSTRLALTLLDALPEPRLAGRRVLDVGCGTGVLALAALRLGARFALGFDIDPLAAGAARANAAANGLNVAAVFFTGPIEALGEKRRFDGVLANMLRGELLPLLPAIARRLAPGGWAIFSGLLDSDLPELAAAIAREGLEEVARRARVDADGERWVAIQAECMD